MLGLVYYLLLNHKKLSFYYFNTLIYSLIVFLFDLTFPNNTYNKNTKRRILQIQLVVVG